MLWRGRAAKNGTLMNADSGADFRRFRIAAQISVEICVHQRAILCETFGQRRAYRG
jgi:hypothetical protein